MLTPSCRAETNGHVQNGESVVDGLLRLAAKSRTFRSADGRFFAQVPVGDRHEVHPLTSNAIRVWLLDSFRSDRGELPSAYAVSRVLDALEAQARIDGVSPALRVRIGRDAGADGTAFFLDLGDSSGRAVRVDSQEWSVTDRPSVPFWRPDGTSALPTPLRDGSIELLRPYVNLSEPDFRLLIGWMAAALLPDGAYPILVIHGEQGSAKTTLAKIVRKLIDPQESPVLAAPRSNRDLMATAFNGWLLAYDNISMVPIWLADGLCRMSTGGGFAGRALFSNHDRSAVHAQRPVILNGIDEFVRRDDLADRCVFLELPPIGAASRRVEREFWRSFEADYPAILGGLLNVVVGGLRELASVHLAELPRMADFARFGEAVGRGLGWPAETFLSGYRDNRRGVTVSSLEDSLLATVLLDSASLGGLWNWTKPATEMLAELSRAVTPKVKGSARWPRSPKMFGDELRRIAPQLRAHGISVKYTRTPKARLITINADRNFDYSVLPHATEELQRHQWLST
jgi:hypothetical protein